MSPASYNGWSTDHSSLEGLMLVSGTRLGSYEVMSPLGAGGMGEVYRARDTRLKRDVALKVLPPSFAQDQERLARFAREAEMLAALNHPNVAAIYGIEDFENTRALVMELVEGETLAERIARGPLAAADALHLGRQIIDALEAAHGQGIVHRDLKPANIKVRPDGTVKVLDFGLAKAFEPLVSASPSASLSPTLTSPAQTLHGAILGTAAYMSPEQARGRPTDQRADSWAFGCVLYEMVTGRRPFEAEDVSLTLARVLERDVELQAIPADVSPRIRNVIAVCLQKDPRRRAQAIGDVRLALEGAFDTVAASPLAVPAARRPLWRRAAPLAAMMAVLVAVIGLGAFRRDPLPAVARFQITAPPGSTLPLGTPAISDDGRMLAYVLTDAQGVSRIYVRPVNRVEARPLPGTEGAVHPFWSHDGRSLGFAVPTEGQLKRIDLDAAAPQTLATTTGPWHGTWSGDDSIVFVAGGALSEVPRTGGTVVPLVTLSAGQQVVNFPSFLPDGKRFLVRAGAGNAVSIQLATRGSAERTPVIDTAQSAPIVAPAPDGRTYLLFMNPPDLMVQEFDERAGAVLGAPRVLVNDIGRVASPPLRPSVGVSPSGVLAYQTGGIGGSGPLTWLDRSGKELEVLPVGASLVVPNLAPDGLQLVGHRIDDGVFNVWVSDLRRGTATRVTFNAPARDPVWSPDGTRIAFRRMNDTGTPGIYVIAAEGGTERKLSDTQGRVSSWSPDGKNLLYDFQGKLMMLPLDGGTPVQVGSRNGSSLRGLFSPDGKYIAFTSDETGRTEIYIQGVPPNTRRMKVSINGGSDARWRRDGAELYFLAPDGSMMAVDVQTAKGLTAGVPRPLFSTAAASRNMTAAGYAVSADGQRFLIPRPDTTNAPITVVLNWWSELRSDPSR